MEKNHRDKLGDFKRNTKFKNIDGKSETLDAIIIRFRNAGFIVPNEEVSYPELISFCHPFLYMRYVVDWKSVKECYIPRGHGDGLSFGKEVCKLWEELCWRNHFWNYGSFKCFKNIDELRSAINKLVGNDIYWNEGSFFDLEARLETDKRNQDAQEEAQRKEEAERKEQQRLALIAENKAKEAARIAEEQARQAAFDEMQRQSEAMKSPNPVWSRTEKVTKKKGRPKKSEVFVESNELAEVFNPFEVSDIRLMQSPLPEAKDNQVLIYLDCLNEACISFGKCIENGYLSARSFNGNLYLCTEATPTKIGEICKSLLSYYKASHFVLFALGENESHNSKLSAYRIIDTLVE